MDFAAIDICREALNTASHELIDTFPGLSVRAYVGDYFDALHSGAITFPSNDKILALCLGSHIGNYDADDAQRLLAGLSAFLRPGDGVLLGIDAKKSSETLERAYNDEGGLMRDFSTNILTRMNRELGTNFTSSYFDLAVVCNEERGSVDSFLRCRRAHDVSLLDGRLVLHFDRNDLVPEESSFKYDVDDVSRLAHQNHFDITNLWFDKAGRFAMYLLARRTDRPSNVIEFPVHSGNATEAETADLFS